MLLFVDTETTGLPKKRLASFEDVGNWPRIVSISWAFFSPGGQMVAQEHAIILPDGFRIPPESARIHKITDAVARKDGKPIKTVLTRLITDVKKRKPTTLVAHNIDFDRNIILAELTRSELDVSLQALPRHCTMQHARDSLRLAKFPRLADLYQQLFSRQFKNSHNASADVLACAECYFEMRKGKPVEIAPGVVISEDADDRELIDRVLEWAPDHDSFDTSFVESLDAYLSEYGRLTGKQRSALQNIIDRWHID